MSGRGMTWGALRWAVPIAFCLAAAYALQDSEEPARPEVEHANCAFFGPKHDEYTRAGLHGDKLDRHRLSLLTSQVSALREESALASIVPAGSRTGTDQRASGTNPIDRYLFEGMQEAGVRPAPPSTDWEFIRRATLDLTGRIPAPSRVIAFVADSSEDKRAKLIDELLQKPEFVDKWTMFFGDLYVNMDNNATTAVRRYPEGRNAFQRWIKDSLASGKPYNQMAAEIISAQGSNSYETPQGAINWTVNGQITNGPVQDTYDQQAANVAETFLGLSQVNCILCHNGRGHLDQLSVWGKTATRVQAWGMAAYFAKTAMRRVPVSTADNQPYYWSVQDTGRADYALNTTTGNRPARCANGLPPVTTNNRTVCASNGMATPEYMFTGAKPQAGENYRAALAREVTGDFQFARAAVNYIWKEFFGRGIVDPVNQFDLARLDSDNPPAAPWSLQPSNARLLKALAQDFIASGYDLKALMRQIANSSAYQLSSRYEGEWNPNNEKLFARKLVRRLWAEEIHDAIVQSSNVLPSYTINGNFGRVTFAMQFPEHRNIPGGTMTAFLDSFLRGNRDDEERRTDGSLAQALNLMNDTFVITRIRSSTSAAGNSLLRNSLTMSDDGLVENLYMNVLSRFPTATEKEAALAALRSGTRTQKAENLLWSLYNKVDFLFNY